MARSMDMWLTEESTSMYLNMHRSKVGTSKYVRMHRQPGILAEYIDRYVRRYLGRHLTTYPKQIVFPNAARKAANSHKSKQSLIRSINT